MVRRHSKNVPWRGWVAPGTHKRTIMRKKCGSKCFLGPTSCNCFPICNPGTCTINKKGIWAAYIRAREYGSSKMRKTKQHTKKVYRKIAGKARKML
jgi:hypothetical protein